MIISGCIFQVPLPFNAVKYAAREREIGREREKEREIMTERERKRMKYDKRKKKGQ